MGLGQFLDQTWIELFRARRPELVRGRSEREILELRREPKLAREITTRFVERNIAMLRQRGLPVTAGTVYLAHFAGRAVQSRYSQRRTMLMRRSLSRVPIQRVGLSGSD
jgi:hypothetical protein